MNFFSDIIRRHEHQVVELGKELGLSAGNKIDQLINFILAEIHMCYVEVIQILQVL